MPKKCRKFLSILIVFSLLCAFVVPQYFMPTVVAADLSSYLYQLPSKTLNAGGYYRQNMSYVVQTRNGKIIVIDGGYATDNSDAEYLLSFLKEKTGKEIPHVDAWIFSHYHEDHIGAFEAIATKYADQITVDTLYYNFPTKEETEKYCISGSAAGNYAVIERFEREKANIKNKDGTPVKTVEVTAKHENKCRGSFAIDTVQFDVLMTCDDVFAAAESDTALYSGTLANNGKAYTRPSRNFWATISAITQAA